MKHCLPEYSFEILDDTGWNFRHALYHEEDRRTLIKAYGMKFLITVTGTARKFDITKTVVIIVTGLGLMGLANIMCDIVLLKSSNQYREKIAEKKYEMIEIKEEQSMAGLMRRLALPYRNSSVMKNGKSPNLSHETTTNTTESTPELNKKPNLQGQIDSLVDAL
jgi:P2X purinoceptor 4